MIHLCIKVTMVQIEQDIDNRQIIREARVKDNEEKRNLHKSKA